MSTFRVRLRLPSGPVTITSPTPPILYSEFLLLITDKIPSTNRPLTIKAGFPPKAITLKPNDSIQGIIRNGDTLIVTVGEASPNRQAPQPKRKRKATTTTTKTKTTSKTIDATTSSTTASSLPPSSTSSRRSKRAASAAATAAMPDIIRAQEKLMRAQKKKKSGKKKSATNKSVSSTKKGTTKKTGIHGMHGSFSSTSSSSSSASSSTSSSSSSFPKRPATKTGIHGLNNNASSRPKKKRKKNLNLKSKTDASEKLISATSGKGDVTSQFFRAATKSAVLKAYETSRALRRFVSAMKGEYTMTMSSTSRSLNSGASTRMTVSFRKGVRSFEEEEIDVLGIEEIKSALMSVLESDSEDAKEQLKPHNMALASPRVFWGIIRHFSGGDECKPVDPMQALHTLLPNADLSFMYTRARQMSEKAYDHMQMMEALAVKRTAARIKRQERAAARAFKNNNGKEKEDEEDEDEDEDEEIVIETVEDICGKEASDILKTLGIETLDDLAKQETATLILRDQTLVRDVVDQFIESARQEIIVRRLAMIVTESNLPLSLDQTFTMETLAGMSGSGSVEVEVEAEAAVTTAPSLSSFSSSQSSKSSTSLSSSSSSSSSSSTALSDTDNKNTALHVILLQDSRIVAPRDLTLWRTPVIVEMITPVAKEMGIEVPTVETISKWRMKAWEHLANQPWLTDYYCPPEEE